jgi:transposase
MSMRRLSCRRGAAELVPTKTVLALRSLACSVRALSIEAREHEKGIRAIIRSWRPDLLEVTSLIVV